MYWLSMDFLLFLSSAIVDAEWMMLQDPSGHFYG